MVSFSVLHLTDLHFGQSDPQGYFLSVQEEFFRDLPTAYKSVGGWDLIIISGDIAYSGQANEFGEADKFLNRLRAEINKLQRQPPPLLAVPGNHDIPWPSDPSQPTVKILTRLGEKWTDDQDIWQGLFDDEPSSYRDTLTQTFSNFSAWAAAWNQQATSAGTLKLCQGKTPGDFSACLVKEDAYLGIIGLNSSLVQLTGRDYNKKLALHPRQLTSAIPGGLLWFDELDAALLVTHHPPHWLAEGSFRDFQSEIDKDGRFVAHLSGHMHVPRTEAISRGFGPGRRLITGGSLFGFEKTQDGLSRVHGYGTLQISCTATSRDGTARYFPRLCEQRGSGTWSFARDQGFVLHEDDGGTLPANGSFQTLRRDLKKSIDEAAHSRPSTSEKTEPSDQPGLPVADFYQGALDALPEVDAKSVNSRFVGRRALLADLHSALDGVSARADATAYQAASATQFIWFHGFGGMGKSWFLRRACIEAAERSKGHFRVGLVDWHTFAWHRPASTPPRNPQEMMDAIALRLTKLYGWPSFEKYWQVRSKVDQRSSVYRQNCERFDTILGILQHYGKKWPNAFSGAQPSELLELRSQTDRTAVWLSERGILRDDTAASAVRIEKLRGQALPYEMPMDGLLDQWMARLNLGDSGTRHPVRNLATTLTEAMRDAAAAHPLVLALDTCEVLSQHVYSDLLHNWLRYVFSPLFDGRAPLLVIAASRDRADRDRTDRFTWDELVDPIHMRSIDFDEIPFTRDDIQRLLETHGIVPERIRAVARSVHRLTLGVPLATTTLLDVARSDPTCDLEELEFDAADAPSLNATGARQKVIEVVAKRFLLHLESRPDDFRDIAALALLRVVNVELLSHFWPRQPQVRLRELTDQYTLLLDGDLHSTVRAYLRQHWRVSPHDQVYSIAESLRNIHSRTTAANSDSALPSVEQELERLNLLSWTKGEDAYPDFARSLAMMLVLDEGIEELRLLAREIEPVRNPGKQVRAMLSSLFFWSSSPTTIPDDVFTWIEKAVLGAGSVRERACLDLLRAVRHAAADRYEAASISFKKAFEFFGANLPRKGVFATAYCRSEIRRENSDARAATDVVRWCDENGFEPLDEWNDDYYWALHNAQHFGRAELYCKTIIERERGSLDARAYLGHIYGVHLNRLQDAEATFREGLKIDEENPTLHFFLGRLLEGQSGREREAEAEFRTTLKFTAVPKDEARIYEALAILYERIGDSRRAKASWSEAVKRDGDNARLKNSYAWRLYEASVNLDEALKIAADASRMRPLDVNIMHTHAAILVRLNQWADARPLIQRYFALRDSEKIKRSWSQDLLLFQDAVKHGHARDLANLLGDTKDQAGFESIRRALLSVCRDPSATESLSEQDRRVVEMLVEQMAGTDRQEFPTGDNHLSTMPLPTTAPG